MLKILLSKESMIHILTISTYKGQPGGLRTKD